MGGICRRKCGVAWRGRQKWGVGVFQGAWEESPEKCITSEETIDGSLGDILYPRGSFLKHFEPLGHGRALKATLPVSDYP